jgi:hypothetical protein
VPALPFWLYVSNVDWVYNETQIQAATALKEVTDRAAAYERHADNLEDRFKDLTRVDRENPVEIALARQPREHDAQELPTQNA